MTARLPLSRIELIQNRTDFTLMGKKPILEVHLFDFDADIYRRHVRVDFLHRIRDEKRFGSLDELKAQIQIDEAQARLYFRSLNA